jgi:nitrogen regulatory protein PII
MSSAQGQVQDLGYSATFPVLLNYEGVPTYFMSLKDNEGLIKQYALVSVTDYSVVGVGNSPELAKSTYRQRLIDVGLLEAPNVTSVVIEERVTRIVSAIVNGQSTYYVTLSNQSRLFVVDVGLSAEIVLTQVGDPVRLTIPTENDGSTVVALTFDNLNYDY